MTSRQLYRRSRGRESALQVLFQDDLNPRANPADADNFLRSRLRNDEELLNFARGIVSGVRRNRAEIDDMLRKAAEHWSIERMAAVERNLLRIAVYEMTMTATPRPVVINEAVELAKRFGSAHSHGFVNGVLDRILKSISASDGQPAASQES